MRERERACRPSAHVRCSIVIRIFFIWCAKFVAGDGIGSATWAHGMDRCRINVNVTIFRALMFPHRHRHTHKHTRSRFQRMGKWMHICSLYLCGWHLTFVSMHWYVELCLDLICIRNEIHSRYNFFYFCLAAVTIRTYTEDTLSQNISHSLGCIVARIRTHGTRSGERRGKISITSTRRCKRWQLSGM